MAMRDRVIPATYGCEVVNRHIRLENSPFVLKRENTEWASRKGVSRTGLVGATGVSGTNAFVIVGEPAEEPSEKKEGSPHPSVFPLSAKTEDALRRYAEKYVAFLKSREAPALDSLAWSVQAGRDAMRCRLAIVASDVRELAEKLEGFVAGEAREGVYYRDAAGSEPDEPHGLVRHEKPDGLAKAWAEGADVDWAELYDGRMPRKAAVPTYPFQRKRCWFDDIPESDRLLAGENSLSEKIKTVFCELFLVEDGVSEDKAFFEMGMTSVHVLRFVEQLRKRLGMELQSDDIFNFPTCRELAGHLSPGNENTGGDGANFDLDDILSEFAKGEIGMEEALLLMDG